MLRTILTLFLFTGFTALGFSAPAPYVVSELLELPPKIEGKVYGDKIRRTMHLLATSTAERPNKVRIVFFGQSITQQGYSTKIIETKLREAYPTAQLEVIKQAIGGFTAPYLVNIMFHTLMPLQPDLIVFHVYGGQPHYEEILRNMRAYTTAEIMNITHHLDNYGAARETSMDGQSAMRRALANKYQCELVEVRRQWRQYINMHQLAVRDLLKDNIHHNKHGGELWGSIQARHFDDAQPADPTTWQDTVSRLRVNKDRKAALGEVQYDAQWERSSTGLTSQTEGATLQLRFTGSRIDVINFEGNGKARIRVDGKKPSEHLGTWAVKHITGTTVDRRPAITRVKLSGIPVAEHWRLTATKISPDGKAFAYSLYGSKSGEQGTGDHTAPFVSENGVLGIDPAAVRFDNSIKKPIPTPQTIRWKTYSTSLDEWTCSTATQENPSGQTTLVQGLDNGEHVLEMIVERGTVSIEDFLIYRPPRQ